jgi:hypothetical protein
LGCLGWEISPTPSAKFQTRVKGSPFTDLAAGVTPLFHPDFASIAGAFLNERGTEGARGSTRKGLAAIYLSIKPLGI